MSTCSNCGALYAPDDAKCPECGMENERSGLRDRVDSRAIDSASNEENAKRENGVAVDRKHAAHALRPQREIAPLRPPQMARVRNVEIADRTLLTRADIHQTNNHEPKTRLVEEPERSQEPTLQDEDSALITKLRPKPDRAPENRENSADDPTAITESASANQNEVLPPAYGSVALAEAAEMESDADDDQSYEIPDESDPHVSRLGSVAQGQRDTAAEQTDKKRQLESPPPDSGSGSFPPPKAETTEDAKIPVRPPVLASESLREQIAPTEPGRDMIRVLSVIVGITGTLIMMLLLGTSGIGLPLAGAFLALTAFALPSIPYAPRAAAIFIISASTLGVVTWIYVGTAGTPAMVVETIGVVTLGIALLFRAWHRASVVARVLVAVGIFVCMGWLGMSGWLKDFTTLDVAWQSWLPTIIRAPFGLLLMLSLLAFMDARTTAGCGIWATAVLLWHALYMTVQLMILVWPKENRGPNWQLLSGDLSTITAASIASPLLTVLVIFGVAQLLAVALNVEARAKQ